MNEKTCFFIGHRETSDDIFPVLEEAVNYHIEKCGVSNFIVGNYGGFDRLAAKAVMNAKQRYDGITLSLLLPYHPAERPVEKPKGVDELFYPEGMEKVPKKAAINRYVVDFADYLIAYVWHSASNARDLVEYAQKREKKGLIGITLLRPCD